MLLNSQTHEAIGLGALSKMNKGGGLEVLWNQLEHTPKFEDICSGRNMSTTVWSVTTDAVLLVSKKGLLLFCTELAKFTLETN